MVGDKDTNMNKEPEQKFAPEDIYGMYIERQEYDKAPYYVVFILSDERILKMHVKGFDSRQIIDRRGYVEHISFEHEY